jgi:aminoglycoside/choline kinase family phosphotransferase
LTAASSPPPGADAAASHAAIAWVDPAREAAFARWLDGIAVTHRLRPTTLRSASSDASFRRYFRIDAEGGATFIVMDAPPPQEDVRPFVAVAALLQGCGLHAPAVLEQDLAQGFLLLADLGGQLYLQTLHEAVARGDLKAADTLMRDAIAALVQWQARADASQLPPYDDALLRRELALFPEWCVEREFGVHWSDEERARWQASCDLLIESALAQPTVAVHRDYMPRNLMVARPNPGILDFQDAVRGPISYDVASLLRDAFISWDEEQEIDWAVRYWQAARAAGLPIDADFGAFWRQLEWMGLQRHLKVLGIFCRLKHRDGKAKYSEDLPRFFAYAHKVATRYQGLGPLARLLEPLMGARRVDAFY